MPYREVPGRFKWMWGFLSTLVFLLANWIVLHLVRNQPVFISKEDAFDRAWANTTVAELKRLETDTAQLEAQIDALKDTLAEGNKKLDVLNATQGHPDEIRAVLESLRTTLEQSSATIGKRLDVLTDVLETQGIERKEHSVHDKGRTHK